MNSRLRLATGFLPALMALGWAAALDAQTRTALHDNGVHVRSLLERPAELTVRNVTLDAALIRLTETSGVIVVFSPSLLRAEHREVSCECGLKTVGEALDRLLAGTRFAYVEMGGQIALVPKPPPVRPAVSEPVALASFGAPAPARQVRPVSTWRSAPSAQVPQEIRIQGVVMDEMTGSPIPGAAVSIEGTSAMTVTGRTGHFALTYAGPGEFTLVVSMFGYRPRRQVHSPSDALGNLSISLAPDPFASEAIVVTGIASARSRSRAEVSVARIAAEELSAQQLYTSIDQLLTGKISGVQLHPAAGYAGGGYRFFVRGGGGLNGDGQPLIIVDGVRIDDSNLDLLWNGGQGYSNLMSLAPSEIETIEVLKGPAAAAMYGTNASNGVVLITTKGGRGVSPETGVAFNYRMNYGQNSMPFDYDPALYRNAGLYNDLLRNGTIREHSIDASGGSGIFRYYFAYQNKSEEGVAPRNHHTRNFVRANVTAVPNDRFTVSVNAGYSANDIERPHSDDAVLSPHWNTIMVDRAWKWYDSTAIASTIAPARNNRTTGTAQVTWNVGRGFDLSGTAGVDYSYHRQDEFYPPEFEYWMGFGGRRRIAERSNTQYTYDVRARYSYEPVRDLAVTSVVGSQIFDRGVTSIGVENRQFATGLISDIGSGSSYIGMWEEKFQERQAGIYTSHTLSYQDRYFGTLSLRQDFASAVGEDAPSIIYPQASVAVRLDEFGVLPEAFNIFKLRAAYGESGQLPGPRDTKRLLWGALGTALGPGAIPTQMGNPSLKPERIRELELGLDAEIANRWSLEATYFRQKAENSIIGRPNAPSTGFGNIIIPYNIGKARGHGIEAALGGDLVRTPRYGLNFKLIWNWQENEVVDLGGEGPIIANYQVNAIAEGMPKHEFYAVVTTGARFDGEGRYIGVVESDGRVRLGNPIPDHTGSFTLNFRFLRDFNLTSMADWGLGKQVFSIFRQFAARNGGYTPFAEMAARLGLRDQWGWITSIDWDDYTPLTPGTPEYTALANEFARMDPFYRGNYIFDADYFVLRELSLSYDATNLMSRFGLMSSGIRGMTVGIAGKNVLRASQYKDGDFEVNAPGARSSAWGIDYGTVPPSRVLNLWVNVAF